jgi:hypothetical protein
MFEYYVDKMYIEWYTEEDVKRWNGYRPTKCCLIDKTSKMYKKFLWAYNKSLECYLEGDFKEGTKFLEIADSYFNFLCSMR